MTVFQHEGTRTVRIAVLGPAAIPCVLNAYTSVVGGSTPWNANGDSFTRDETLDDFSARVPHTAGGVCAPRPSEAHGTVAERAIVRSGYLIDLTLIVSVPSAVPGAPPRTASRASSCRCAASAGLRCRTSEQRRSHAQDRDSPASSRARRIAAMRSRWYDASPKVTWSSWARFR